MREEEAQGARTKRGRVSDGGRQAERLARSRSSPGFSIGILLSVKVILPVNGVFIPPLNEIHRSTRRGSEGAMTKRGGRILPILFSSSYSSTLSDARWRMKNQRGINKFLSKWNKWNCLFYSIPHPWSVCCRIYPATSHKERERGEERESEKGEIESAQRLALCKWNALFLIRLQMQ